MLNLTELLNQLIYQQDSSEISGNTPIFPTIVAGTAVGALVSFIAYRLGLSSRLDQILAQALSLPFFKVYSLNKATITTLAPLRLDSPSISSDARASPSLALPSTSSATFSSLPLEIQQEVLQHCDLESALNLTSTNRQLFASRFYSPCLQHLHFDTNEQVEKFLARAAKMRHPKDFGGVKKLSLTLSEKLSTERCSPLFDYLQNVHSLEICLPANTELLAAAKILFQAAQSLPLHRLRSTRYSLFPFTWRITD